MNVTKLELCNRVSKKLDAMGKKFPASGLEGVFETFIDEILSIMSEGKNLELRGFGSFKTKTRKERTGRNPRTGIMVTIPSYQAPIFKFSKDGQRVFAKKIEEYIPNKVSKKVFTATRELKPRTPTLNNPPTLKMAENFKV